MIATNPVLLLWRRIAEHPVMRHAASEWLMLVVFVLLVVPAGPNEVLVPLLAVSTVFGLVMLPARPIGSIAWSALILAFAAAGAVLVVHGALRGNPGWRDVGIALVGGPIAWFLMAQLSFPLFSARAIAIVSYATITISVIIYALTFNVGDGLIQMIEPGAYGVRSGGRSRVNFVGVTTLLATVPFLASIVFDRAVYRVREPQAALATAALLISIPAVVLSGRQGVIGTVALLPALGLARWALGFNLEARPQIDLRRLAAALAIVPTIGLLAAWRFGLSFRSLLGDVFGAVGLGDEASSRVEYSAGVRSRQSDSLLTEFMENPLLGRGAGAVARDFHTWRGFELGSEFRFTPRTWRAELSYQLLLFEGGVLGALLYLAAIALAARLLLRGYRSFMDSGRVVVRAAVMCSLAILVGATFDPHLRAVGSQVLLFFPIIIAVSRFPPFGRLPAERTDQPSNQVAIEPVT